MFTCCSNNTISNHLLRVDFIVAFTHWNHTLLLWPQGICRQHGGSIENSRVVLPPELHREAQRPLKQHGDHLYVAMLLCCRCNWVRSLMHRYVNYLWQSTRAWNVCWSLCEALITYVHLSSTLVVLVTRLANIVSGHLCCDVMIVVGTEPHVAQPGRILNTRKSTFLRYTSRSR